MPSLQSPPLRADAARNRALILDAAIQAFREVGTAVALDEIARRAGVNIATLYRRFPDREALITQVLVEGFTVVRGLAQAARDAARVDPLAAVEDYYAGLVGQQDRLALPLVGGPASDDPQVARLKAETFSALEELLTLSQEAGVLRCDVTVLDLVAAGAMACRPLPNLPADQAAALAARNVRVFVDGLCTPSPQALPPLAP